MTVVSTLRPRLRPESRRPHRRPAPPSRRRSAGGPEDRALYRCGCGHAFHAEVTASVDCPRCGAGQPW